MTVNNGCIIVSTLDKKEIWEPRLLNIMNRDFAIYAKTGKAKQAGE